MEAAGELTADAVWEGDVSLQGDVVVPEGVTLRLRAGTALSFAAKPRWSCAVFRSAPEGYPIEASSREQCDLVVFGRLEVEGSTNRPILIGGPQERWGGITLLDRGTALLQHARLQGAAGGEDALIQCFDDSRLELRDCVLSRARIGVLAWGLSRVVAHDTIAEDLGCAFFIREGSTTDLFRVLCRRAEQGVWGQNWGLVNLEDCRFEDCSGFGAGGYDHSRLTVSRGIFESCGQGLLGATHARIDAVGAEFKSNRAGVAGIESARMSLRGCRFSTDRASGIFIKDEARIDVADCAFHEPAPAVAGRA
jgi:hypothetical protein